MRVLMWFTVGFAIACGLSAYLGIGVWFALLVIPAAILLFLWKKATAKIVATVLLGVVVGMLWSGAYDYFYLNDIRQYDGETVNTTAIVSDYSYDTSYGVAADAKITVDGKSYNLRLYYPIDLKLEPGDQIKGDFRFRMTTDDAIQGGTYHQGDGIFLLAYVSDTAVVEKGDSNSFLYWGVRLRRSISQTIREVFPEDTYAFATALLLGDSNALSYETDTDFKVSGIRHVIAVSGLHVSILMSIVYLFCGRRRYLSALIGLPLLLLFAAVVGFTPSVVRACIMQALVLLALMLNQDYDPPTALAFAILTMLCLNPMTITSVSFQLSCGCVIGILMFYNPINDYLLHFFKLPKGKSRKKRLIRGICSGISITLCTAITTTPLSAFYFGSISIVGVLTNLLTLWVIGFVFWGIGICCIVSYIYLPLARAIAWVVSIPIRYVIGVAGFLGDLPFAAVYTCSIYVVIWIVMCYALLVVFYFSKKKHPLILSSCVCVGLVLAVALSWITPGNPNYQITVFDVGQGQSVLIESEDHHYLVDCGGDSPKVAADTVRQQLLSRGITRLDGIIITHYDVDHAGAVPLLLTAIDTDRLYLPDIEDGGYIRKQLETDCNSISWIDQQFELKFGESMLTMIPGEEKAANDNERSLCILFQRQNCDILITGDRTTTGEKALMNQVQLPELELLVVGHHGSKTSTGFELLQTTRPKAAVISVGRDNYHSHPSKEVLQKLKLFGSNVWRTDRDGTLIFRG